MKTKPILLLIGGGVQVLILAMHLAIAFQIQRQPAPAGLAADVWINLKASQQIYNATVTAAVLCFAYVSLFQRAELLGTSLGRTVCALVAVFYLQRVVVGTIVRDFDPVFGVLLLALTALYAFAALPPRARQPR